MTSDMTHPTDDELETEAVRLEDGRVCSPAQNSCRNGYLMLEAAAMLRACKGRVKRLPRTDGEGGWTLPVELLAEIRDEVYANEWDAPCAEVIEIIALSVETRILAALDPAPDHAEWDAALTAARNACVNLRNSDELENDDQRVGALHCALAISELKKGPPQ